MPGECPAVIWVLSLLSDVHLMCNCACPFQSLNPRENLLPLTSLTLTEGQDCRAAADLIMLAGPSQIHCQEDLETGNVA